MRALSEIKKAPKRLLLSVAGPLAAATILLQVLAITETRGIIDQNVFHPFIFHTRELIRPQNLDPRIKILTFGDSTASTLNAFDISLPDWGMLLREISKTGCHSIIIDKLFDSPYTEDDIKKFTQLIDGVESRNGIISFTYAEEIRARHEIGDDVIAGNQSKIVSKGEDQTYLSSFSKPQIPYGARDSLLSRFGAFGHNEYTGDTHSKAFFWLRNSRVLPNAALAIADSVSVTNGRVLVNGNDIHADSRGQFLLNFAPRNAYKQKGQTYSFSGAFLNAQRGHGVDIIKPGDYVVILPAMYTGNTDFKQTPFGSMPGGYTLVSVVQSILTNNWLREIYDPGFIVIIFCISGFLLGLTSRTRNSILGLMALVIVTTSTSVLLFALGGIAWSFILPVASMILGCMAGIIVHSSIASLEESRIARDLEVATLVHNSFFAGATPTDSGATRVQGGFIPATECGGDWWGTFHKHGHSYVMLGDAVGHGIPAALVTAVAFSVTRTVEMELEMSEAKGVMPSRILSAINKVLCTVNSDRACMTFQVFRVEDKSGECVYANAGNPQPILVPRDTMDPRLGQSQRIKTLMARGNILGLDRETEFTDHTIRLTDGDRILLYTDGLIENKAKANGEPIGKDWLKRKLESLAQQTTTSLYENLWSSYKETSGNLMPEDDVTIVIITAPSAKQSHHRE